MAKRCVQNASFQESCGFCESMLAVVGRRPATPVTACAIQSSIRAPHKTMDSDHQKRRPSIQSGVDENQGSFFLSGACPESPKRGRCDPQLT